MSRNLIRFTLTSIKYIMQFDIKNEPVRNLFKFSFHIGIFTIGTIGHLTYTLATTEKDKSIIKKKYKMERNGFTDFMVIDDRGRHFNINNSFWYWKWNSIEDWHKMETSKEITIKYYGWRVPLLGLFPNIIMTRQETLFGYMSRIKFKSIDCDYGEKKEIQLTKEEREEIAKPLNPYHELWRKTSKYD